MLQIQKSLGAAKIKLGFEIIRKLFSKSGAAPFIMSGTLASSAQGQLSC